MFTVVMGHTEIKRKHTGTFCYSDDRDWTRPEVCISRPGWRKKCETRHNRWGWDLHRVGCHALRLLMSSHHSYQMNERRKENKPFLSQGTKLSESGWGNHYSAKEIQAPPKIENVSSRQCYSCSICLCQVILNLSFWWKIRYYCLHITNSTAPLESLLTKQLKK